MEERRRHPRLGYEDAVMIKLYWVEGHPELAGKAMMGTTVDVSQVGVRICCSNRIEPGSKLSLCVVMTEPHGFFPMRGIIQWANEVPDSREWQMGVEFEAEEHDLGAWHAFIRELESQQGELAGRPPSVPSNEETE